MIVVNAWIGFVKVSHMAHKQQEFYEKYTKKVNNFSLQVLRLQRSFFGGSCSMEGRPKSTGGEWSQNARFPGMRCEQLQIAAGASWDGYQGWQKQQPYSIWVNTQPHKGSVLRHFIIIKYQCRIPFQNFKFTLVRRRHGLSASKISPSNLLPAVGRWSTASL